MERLAPAVPATLAQALGASARHPCPGDTGERSFVVPGPPCHSEGAAP